MRNPFACLAPHAASKPTLRERLNATKDKARQVLAVNRALLLPASRPTTQTRPCERPADTAHPPSDLALACHWALAQREWVDGNASALSEERLEEEDRRVNAVFTRAIGEPSADLCDLSAKAALALEDYERFTAVPGQPMDDGKRIVLTVLREARALAGKPAAPVEADPILAMIDEGRRLLTAVDAAYAASTDATDDDPRFVARNELARELWDYVGSAILQTVPLTAAGCRELARFGVEYRESQGVSISDDEEAITSLIAKSPLRAEGAAISCLNLSSVPLSALFAMADIYSTGMRHFEVAGFWPKLQGGTRQPAADIVIHEGDRLSLIWRDVTDEIVRRTPDAADTTSIEEYGEWKIRRALADCRWADAEKAAIELRNAVADEG